MRYLLDTHVLIWLLHTPQKLSKKTARLLENTENLTVSIASLWEITIKSALGKLIVSEDFIKEIQGSSITILSINIRHLTELKTLPPHHSDPFDRMLVAQAKAERLAMITGDQRMHAYDIKIIPV